jgi:hypothetical protein
MLSHFIHFDVLAHIWNILNISSPLNKINEAPLNIAEERVSYAGRAQLYQVHAQLTDATVDAASFLYFK